MSHISITFTVQGLPIAKGRPRFTRRGFAYTPQKTKDYELQVQHVSRMAMAGTPPYQGAVHLQAQFFMPIPKGWRKSKVKDAESGVLPHISRPDLDNCIKAVADAMNGIVFGDDSQITKMIIEKRYSTIPRADIKVMFVGD